MGISPDRLHHARRARDGQPLRGDVGPVPLHTLHRGREHEHPRLLLPAEQARPQLLLVPRDGQPGRRRRSRQHVRPVRQGVQGDHEPVLHSRRAARRQGHHRLLLRRRARFQLLAVLAHHVRIRELAQRARDEALHPTFRAPRRRPARLQRAALHPVQPVRIPHLAHGELPEGPRRAVPFEHRSRRRHVLQHRGAQSGHRGADDMRGSAQGLPPLRERSPVHHQRQLRGQLVLRVARRAGAVQHRARTGNRVRPVAAHRPAGPVVRAPRKVHRRSGEVQLDERHRHDARREDRPLHREDLPPRSVLGRRRNRRHRHRQRLELASKLDVQPAAPVPRPTRQRAVRLDIRSVHRCARATT